MNPTILFGALAAISLVLFASGGSDNSSPGSGGGETLFDRNTPENMVNRIRVRPLGIAQLLGDAARQNAEVFIRSRAGAFGFSGSEVTTKSAQIADRVGDIVENTLRNNAQGIVERAYQGDPFNAPDPNLQSIGMFLRGVEGLPDTQIAELQRSTIDAVLREWDRMIRV